MATHTLNKKLLAGVVALTGAFVLSACNPVEALPTRYNENILFDDQGNPIPTNDNIIGALFDAIASGKESKVLDVIMEELVNEKFGVKLTDGSGYRTYSAIMECDTDDKKEAYCDAHKELFVRDGDTKQDKVKRFDYFVKDINKRINAEFYSLITSSEYKDTNGRFDESELIKKLKDTYDIDDAATPNKFFVTSEITKENAYDKLGTNKSLYTRDEAEILERVEGLNEHAQGYIEKKVFPKILKDKIIEEYILKTEARALGNASARQINYVKVPFTSDNRTYVESIISQFNDEFIYKVAVVDSNRTNEVVDFDIINHAMIGFDKLNSDHFKTNSDPLIDVNVHTTDDASEKWINDTFSDEYDSARVYNKTYYDNLSTFNQTYHEPVFVKVIDDQTTEVRKEFKTADGHIIFDQDFTVYADTELGKLLKDYNKALNANKEWFTATQEEKDALNRFENAKGTLGDSLKDEILTLAGKDITTNEWCVKNGGANELPSSIRDRLFRLSVATNFEDFFKEVYSATPAESTIGNYRYVNGETDGELLGRIPYIRNINGRKFMMASDAPDFTNNKDNFVKEDNNTFCICQVLEAVSYAKIDPNSKTCYKIGEDVDYTRIEETQREISKVLSTKDTYSTSAFTEYLNQYKFRFGDTSMYEYLKGQYPDLDIFSEE